MVKHSIKKHTISFKHAGQGIKHAFLNQPNLRIHLICALAVIAFSWYVKLSNLEWIIILFTILWVVVSEMINTAMESIVDLITHEYRKDAKIAKDVAAGTVLIGAIGAVVVALIILMPKLMRILESL